jgi:hypothetical protein
MLLPSGASTQNNGQPRRLLAVHNHGHGSKVLVSYINLGSSQAFFLEVPSIR